MAMPVSPGLTVCSRPPGAGTASATTRRACQAGRAGGFGLGAIAGGTTTRPRGGGAQGTGAGRGGAVAQPARIRQVSQKGAARVIAAGLIDFRRGGNPQPGPSTAVSAAMVW